MSARAVAMLGVVWVIASAMIGCASPRGGSFQPSAMQQDESMIFVYRPAGGFGSDEILIKLDGERRASLRAGEHVALSTGPGMHVLTAESRNTVSREVPLQPGEVVYLEVNLSAIRSRVELDWPESAVALERIRDTVGGPG